MSLSEEPKFPWRFVCEVSVSLFFVFEVRF